MSWRDKFNGGVGSLDKAEFIVESDTMTFGRRKVKHEYLLRDEPFLEDLGGSADEFTMTVFVIGDDYMTARDKLITVLKKPGVRTLFHPYFGTMYVEVFGRPSKSERTSEGGKASFSITFIRVNKEQQSLAVVDTGEQLGKAIDDAQDAALNDFTAVYNTFNQAQDYVDELQAELNSALLSVETVVSGITSPIASLIRSPFNMGSAIIGTLNNIQNAFNEPLRALNLYDGLFYSGYTAKPIPKTTVNRIQQVNNTAATHRLIQQAAITEACRLQKDITYASADEAIAVRDTLLDAIDAQLEEPAVQGSDIIVSDSVHYSLEKLRTALNNFVRVEAAKLPRITHYETPTTLPAIVLAYRIYGDVSRDAEIISRNKIRQPGFVMGRQTLEILTDA